MKGSTDAAPMPSAAAPSTTPAPSPERSPPPTTSPSPSPMTGNDVHPKANTNEANMHKGDGAQGEGNTQADVRYREKATAFAQSHDTEQLARDAAPRDADEARQLEEAEEKGKARAVATDEATVGNPPR